MPSFGRDPAAAPAARARRVRGRRAHCGGGTENLPGTTIGGGGDDAGIFATENGGQIVANGARTGENNYQIDGVGVTSVSWGGTTVDHAERGRDQGSQGHHQQLRRRERPLSRRAGADHLAERHQPAPRQRVLQGESARPERVPEVQRLWPSGAEEHRRAQRLRRHGGRPDSQEQAVRVLLVRDDPRQQSPNTSRAGIRRRSTWAPRRPPAAPPNGS